MREQRVSPRQAIVGMQAAPAGWAGAFALPLLLDVLGTLVAVDGATLALCLADADAAAGLAERLPAGIDVLAGVPAASAALFGVAQELVGRRFERVVFVAADAVGLTTRLMSTALSALATEPALLGRTPEGGTYLVGVRGELVERDPARVETLLGLLGATGIWRRMEGRQVEPLPRLSELMGLPDLRSAVRGHERYLPRLVRQLHEGA